MKKTLFICLTSLLLSLLISCNSVPGETSAGYSLRNDIIKGIGYWELSEGGSHRPKILNTKKSDADQAGLKELWTVNRNGTLVEYEVKLIPDGNGGTFIEISKGSIKNDKR